MSCGFGWSCEVCCGGADLQNCKEAVRSLCHDNTLRWVGARRAPDEHRACLAEAGCQQASRVAEQATAPASSTNRSVLRSWSEWTLSCCTKMTMVQAASADSEWEGQSWLAATITARQAATAQPHELFTEF